MVVAKELETHSIAAGNLGAVANEADAFYSAACNSS
jgi:hypothetical protein